jgi:hypothetical protein
MVLTVVWVLVIGAFIVTLWSAGGKVPLWVAVLLLVIVHLLTLMPAK